MTKSSEAGLHFEKVHSVYEVCDQYDDAMYDSKTYEQMQEVEKSQKKIWKKSE